MWGLLIFFRAGFRSGSRSVSTRRSQLPHQVQWSSRDKVRVELYELCLRIVYYSSMLYIYVDIRTEWSTHADSGSFSFSSFQYCIDVVTVETLVWCLTIQLFMSILFHIQFYFQYSSLSGPPPDSVQSS